MNIYEMSDSDTKEKTQWDMYVNQCSQATVFHLTGWKDVMVDTYGLRSHYLLARNKDQFLGGLPLLHVNSRLSGHYLTSMPGGICAQDEETAQALIEQAKALVKTTGAKYLHLRDSHHEWNLPDFITGADHCTFIAELSDCPTTMWKKIDRRVRQHIRKAIKDGLNIKFGPEHLEEFYRVYSKAMRDMGTPTFGLKFFHNVLKKFPNLFSTIMVYQGDRLLGGILIAFFQDTIYTTWWGMLRQHYKLRSCHILHWETLKFGCEQGYHYVDLGRSSWDSGTFKFKSRWPAEPKPLYQQCYLQGISDPPAVGNEMEENTKYRLFMNFWKRMPIPLTDIIGPQLRKSIPFG